MAAHALLDVDHAPADNREHKRRSIAGSKDSPPVALLMSLQRSAGNAAVAELLARRPSTVGSLPKGAIELQRCGPTPCNCSDDERAEYAATRPEMQTIALVEERAKQSPLSPELISAQRLMLQGQFDSDESIPATQGQADAETGKQACVEAKADCADKSGCASPKIEKKCDCWKGGQNGHVCIAKCSCEGQPIA
jgi:hypothetical protein